MASVKKGVSEWGGWADTTDGARGKAADLPVGMDPYPTGGLHTGLVSLETATSSQSQAVPLPAPAAGDLSISATVVLEGV